MFAAVGGLDQVEEDLREAPSHLAISMHECNLMLHELLARTTKNEAMAKELEGLLVRVADETRKGACWAFTRFTVVGRKPETADA
ncbi:hypothetical protein CIB48_g10717 [Xylaria polymorpha]|nr:hypothetical protein CIB48_g10717 [Xylaria polymorpha]